MPVARDTTNAMSLSVTASPSIVVSAAWLCCGTHHNPRDVIRL